MQVEPEYRGLCHPISLCGVPLFKSMSQYKTFKHFIATELNALPECLPRCGIGDSTNPELNAALPRPEWIAESPIAKLDPGQRDWQHIFAVDASSGDRFELFFERLRGGIAVAWARLHYKGQALTLREACYKDNSDGKRNLYSAGGIRLQCTGAFRHWRLRINALFQIETAGSGPGQELRTGEAPKAIDAPVHVRLSARISSTSHPFEIPKRCPPTLLSRRFKSMLAHDGLDKARRSVIRCCSGLEAVAQGIVLYSELSLNDVRHHEEVRLLHGCRLKFVGRSDLFEVVRHHTGYAANGSVFHLIESDSGKCDGFCFHPSFFDLAITNGLIRRSLSSRASGHDASVRSEPTMHNFIAGTTSLVLSFDVVSPESKLSHVLSLTAGKAASCVSSLNTTSADAWRIEDFEGDLKRGSSKKKFKVYGVTFTLPNSYKLPSEKLKRLALLKWRANNTASVPRVLGVFEHVSRNPLVTGDKGSSLAVLSAIANHRSLSTQKTSDKLHMYGEGSESHKDGVKKNHSNSNIDSSRHDNHSDKDSVLFKVPSTVILSVAAYETFSALPAVRDALGELLRATIEASGKAGELEILRAASERCETTLTKMKLPSCLELPLDRKLAEVFGARWEHRLRFAVRSSPIHEDESDEAPIADQLTTLLGVSGRQAMHESIVRCWSSQFAFAAANHRRQCGRSVLETKMAVVIQEMARPRCAGVMVTCDPMSGNPGRVTISANFGLGPSVTAGAITDPDTFVLQRSAQPVVGRTPTMRLVSKTLGTKDRMTVESVIHGGVEEKLVTSSDAQKFCLSDEQAVQIASLGMEISELTGTPCNIEWAFEDDQIALLRFRAVSAISRESIFEI